METRAMAIICRIWVVLIVFALTTVVANANSLLNPGFETAGTNDATAANWNQFGGANRHGTNDTLVSIHSGGSSMQTISPGTPTTDATGAYQDVAASAGQNWRLTGYLLTWQNNRLTGPDGFGQAQLVFLDNTGGTGNVLQVVYGPAVGTDAPMPVNTWVPIEVDATNAPAGTAKVRTYVLYVGNSLDAGSIFFDDMNLYQPTGASSTITPVVQPAVQISWPTSSPTNGIGYQIQSTTNFVLTIPPPATNVVVNGGFETNATPWGAFNGAGQATTNTLSSPPNVARTGAGAMRLSGAGVPGCFQDVATVTGGQVWDLQGYAYNSGMDNSATRALLKIVWNDAGGGAVAAVNPDPNLIGTVDFAPNAGVTSTPQMSGTSPAQWTFLEARATAPSNAVTLRVFCLLVSVGGTETVHFDDISAFQPVSSQVGGWTDFGPLWLGNGHTNQVFDPIGSNLQKFYRVTTP